MKQYDWQRDKPTSLCNFALYIHVVIGGFHRMSTNPLLAGKRILVTGSTAGIGREIAAEVIREGGQVIVHGTRPTEIEKTASERGPSATGISVDLSAPDGSAELIRLSVEALGGLDGLVNNAGIFPRTNIDQVTPELFEKIFAVNARAPVQLIQAAMPYFRAQGEGAVVNIGSINAHCGQPDLLIYSMSKGALQTMTRNLGDALGGEHVRVNQLNVGWTYTETEHRTQIAEGRSEDWLDHVPDVFAPSGTLLKPHNIAPHAVFWLSDRSKPITGQVYEIEQYPVIGRNRVADS